MEELGITPSINLFLARKNSVSQHFIFNVMNYIVRTFSKYNLRSLFNSGIQLHTYMQLNINVNQLQIQNISKIIIQIE